MLDTRKSTLIRRRGFLSSIGCALASGITSSRASSTFKNGDIQKSGDILGVIEHYSVLGHHQTGSKVDALTLDWLSKIIASMGLHPRHYPYVLDRVKSFKARLQVGELEWEGMPLYDCLPTGEVPVSGHLDDSKGSNQVRVMTVPPHSALDSPEGLDWVRREAQCQAIVAITGAIDKGLKPGLTPRNAPAFASPFGPPVVQLPMQSLDGLSDLIANRAPAKLSCSMEFSHAQSSNVVVHVSGRNPDLEPLVVMTPLTGWWNCASERGGGVAMWLHLMDYARSLKLARPVIFVGTTGHELGYTGLKHLKKTTGELTLDVHAWLHLGAAFCGKNAFITLQVSNPQIEQVAVSSMQRNRVSPNAVRVAATHLHGEIAEVAGPASSYLSVSGMNPWFHHPDDQWHTSIDVEQTQAMQSAITTWFDYLSA